MDASALRWVLAIIGIVLLLGIYLYGLHQSRLRKRAAVDTFTREEIDSAFIEERCENFDAFKKLHPAFGHLTEKDMVTKGISAPIHGGAMRYYKERGWM